MRRVAARWIGGRKGYSEGKGGLRRVEDMDEQELLQYYRRISSQARFHKEMIDLIKSQVRSHGGPNAMLDPRVKQNLFELRKSDPQKWSVNALANHFQMKKERVRALLYFMGKRADLEAEGHTLDDTIEQAFGEYFGKVDRLLDKTILSETKHKFPRHLLVEEDADQPIYTELLNERTIYPSGRRRGEPPMVRLPHDPPAGVDGKSHEVKGRAELEGMELLKNRRKYRRNTLVMEIANRKTGLHITEAERMLLIQEPDGPLRTADWEERKQISNRYFVQNLPRGVPEEQKLFGADTTFLADNSSVDESHWGLIDEVRRVERHSDGAEGVSNEEYDATVADAYATPTPDDEVEEDGSFTQDSFTDKIKSAFGTKPRNRRK